MATIRDYYDRVNAAWPKPLPKLTEKKAVNAARRLYRFVLKRTFRGAVQVTTGNRRNAIRRGVLIVNPGTGWHDLVHDLAHLFFYRLHPNEKPHNRKHARLELRMVREVVKRGWLNDARARRAREGSPLEKAQQAVERLEATMRDAEKQHERRMKSLRTRLAKARRSLRYHEKRPTGVAEPRKTRAATTPSWVPTVAAVRSRLGADAHTIEAGTRNDAENVLTYDSRAWPEDNDLVEMFPLSEMLSWLRKEQPANGVVADLYVHDRTGSLVSNATLQVSPEGWSVKWN